MKAKSSRGILMKLICCTALVVFTSVFAFSQTPKSGALLSIDGTGASSGVHVRIYDSQIHSGHVQAAPTCGAGDQIPTDAYVLQGGSATGCDTGDAFEVTDGGGSGDHNTSLTHQDPGQKDLFGFRIATHYLSVPVVSITSAQPTDDGTTTTYSYTRLRGDDIAAGENIAIGGFPTIAGTDNGNFSIISVTPGSFVTDNSSGVPYTFSTGPDATGTASTGASGPSVAVCNHDGSICASPDTGFLTVTNNTESLSPVRYLSPAHRPAVERPPTVLRTPRSLSPTDHP